MKILPTLIKPSEYVRTVFSVTAKHGQSFEDFKDPDSWAHVANTLRKFDRVEIVAEDGSFFAEGIVTKVTKVSAHIHFFTHVELSKSAESSVKKDLAYNCEFAGPHKWRIIRISDQEIVEKGIETKEDAQDKVDKLNESGE
ncbi:hypothetical protein NUG10_002555 [Yersinia enterocolitica]|nr:hypothetical protein [Yersinia enterocolitica]EKN3872886.1 hypothetical protein [Yersinia enterocolitica]